MRDREPDYLTEQAATILHAQLVALDREIDAKLDDIARANGVIVEAGNRVDALWMSRERLSRELSKRADPEWTPSSPLPMAMKSARRFHRKHPLPGVVLPSSVREFVGDD
jgi:hypothetical protein